ncbi:MAG TPA: hypothetical protein VJ045_03255 [Hyphomicrobiaceae bacterium]|nr:hypothetical protein [Hyphomicrobiaceae bacterium]
MRLFPFAAALNRALWAIMCAGGLIAASPKWAGPALAAEVVQYFPDGTQPPEAESGWRLNYEILRPNTHGYGGSAVLVFTGVEFMRGYKPPGEQDWIRILNNLVLVEMYVPYNDGTEIFDITGYSFDLVPASAAYLPPSGIIRGAVQPDGVVIAEVVDENVRWMDNAIGGDGTRNKVRRGQSLELWATLSASNYRYVLRYGFADDGSIRVRAGGTAANLRSVPAGEHAGVHVHMPAWRMEFDLGAASANRVDVVEREYDPARPAADVTHRAVTAETGVVWNAEKFTTLKVTSTQSMNRHEPPLNIAYKIVPMRSGSTRTYRDFTKFDFWISRRDPATEPRATAAPELRFVDVPDNISNPEPVEGQPVVIWHHAAVHHIPRTEDFGRVGWSARDGVAINHWTGFDLMPHNFWDKTPLFKR